MECVIWAYCITCQFTFKVYVVTRQCGLVYICSLWKVFPNFFLLAQGFLFPNSAYSVRCKRNLVIVLKPHLTLFFTRIIGAMAMVTVSIGLFSLLSVKTNPSNKFKASREYAATLIPCSALWPSIHLRHWYVHILGFSIWKFWYVLIACKRFFRRWNLFRDIYHIYSSFCWKTGHW